MGIRYFVFTVNKMDLVGYSKERFEEIQAQIEELAAELNLENIKIIPVSATEGDNVTKQSENISWYQDETLLFYLETVNIEESLKEKGFYMPVQRVCRPNHTFRGFQGEIESGTVSVGDEITTYPSQEKALVKSIHILDQESESATAGNPVTIQLNREVDVSRGCVLSKESGIQNANSVITTLLWMDDTKLEEGKSFFVKIGTKLIPGNVTKILHSIDANTGEEKKTHQLVKNEIAVCQLTFSDEIVVDLFEHHKTLGELILIDRITNMTSACGIITEIAENEEGDYQSKIDKEKRSQIKGQRAITVEFPLGEAGITDEFLEKVEKELINRGRHTYLFRPKNGEPVKDIVKHLNEAGILVLLAKTNTVDTNAFKTDRSYYSDWISTEKLDIEETINFLIHISGTYADEVSYKAYI
jgi:sulfate adenylyltransferase subunit 1